MEVGDCSIWHHLIFCEEFVNNIYENNVTCWVCQAIVSGYPAFKCLECDFVQHKSCLQLLDLIEMYEEHDIIDKHHLILQEETENDAKEEVFCVGCVEVLSGPAYRCSIPQCTFHLHKSCHQLSHAIQHAAHPEHTLILHLPPLKSFCNFCGKNREKGITLLYGCRSCNFDLDSRCASSMKLIDVNCEQHAFILCQKSIPFLCEACGEEGKDVACHCSICGILTHPKCAYFPRIIRIKVHNHSLYRTYCLRRVKKLEKAICKLCSKKVNTECGAYYCQICNCVAHMECAKICQDESTLNSEATEFDDYERHLVYLIEGLNVEEDKTVDASSKIHHYSHPQHELILSYEDPQSDKRCKACMQFIIFAPFYCCDECQIFLHKRCVEVPETIWRKTFSTLPSTLSSQQLETNKFFFCAKCLRYRHGFFYDHEDWQGKFRNDIQCFLIPETINHESHEHLLHIPFIVEYGEKEICPGCVTEIQGSSWHIMCSDCKFWLCFQCATLPLVARYRYHPHFLKLTYTCKDDLGECYCLICEEKKDPKHWFYSCADCDFTAHIQCVIGSPLKKGSHQHPVIVVEGVENFPKCHSCEEGISDYLSIECTQCKFNFHIECYYSTL